MKKSTSHDRINHIAKITGAKSYLEIGVRNGDTFFKVDIERKVAVDPLFGFNIDTVKNDSTCFYQIASDQFFNDLDVDDIFLPWISKGTCPTFDIIFIDGLHTFEQSFRDFKNSLRFSHDNTVWLLDDTVPCDPYSALPDADLALEIRKWAGIKGKSWHGDVFKTVFAIHDFFPQFAYCTLMGGNPQTVLKKTKTSSRKAIFNSENEIKKLSYFDMLSYAWVFAPVDDEFLDIMLSKNIEVDEFKNTVSWKRLIYSDIFCHNRNIVEKIIHKYDTQGFGAVVLAAVKRLSK